MIEPELSDIEIHAGALRVYYPAEDRMLYVTPIEVLTSRVFGYVFELTPGEEELLRDKAIRLEEKLISLGR